MPTFRCLLPLLLALVMGSTFADAQASRALVRGRVTDHAGAAVPGASVRIARGDTNESRTTTTDAGGYFALAQLEPGEYRVDVTTKGFATYTRQAQLAAGQRVWLDVPLEAARRQDIDVSAPYVLIDRDAAGQTTLVDPRQVGGLPLDRGDPLDLVSLAPGLDPVRRAVTGSARPPDVFSINGGRTDANAFLLDGITNVTPSHSTAGVRPPGDGIYELAIDTSAYDASYGRGAGQVNAITKSGANRYAGTGYGFFRSGAFSNRNAFAPEDEAAPDYSRNQIGGSLGGPIVTDRLFFFGDVESTRLNEGITRVGNVPTLAERQGDFSQSRFARPIDPVTRQPYPGGQLPASAISPVGAAIAALYPLPNRDTPFANFVASPTGTDDVDQFDGRIDRAFSGASRLTARYSFSDRRAFDPFAGGSGLAVPGFGRDIARRGQNLLVAYTQPAGRALVNDVRVGYTSVTADSHVENPQIGNGRVGLRALATDPRDAGLSAIAVNGYAPLGHAADGAEATTSHVLEVRDTATWSSGPHLVTFGAELSTIRRSGYRDAQTRGFLDFSDGTYAGNALANLLLGLPALTSGVTGTSAQNLRAASWGLFVQDDWRALPSLTISAGLRYDYVAPPVDADDRASLYDPSTGQVMTVGSGGLPRGGFKPDRNNVGPRAGFAWTLDRAARTVARGGYGISYLQSALTTADALYANPPDSTLVVRGAGPQLTLTDPFGSASSASAPPSVIGYQRDLQTPWMEHWNIGVQRQYGPVRSIEFAYVGSRGHDLLAARDINQPDASAVASPRPSPLFADITMLESRASSEYHALQVQYQQRTNRGLAMLLAYTLGKSKDDASGVAGSAGDAGFPQNSLDPAAEWARSSFDVRHRFTASFAYELPLGGSIWLRDLEVQGIVTIETGRPFTVRLRPDVDNSNTGFSAFAGGYGDRPNVIGDPSVETPTADLWFNPAAFSLPAFGTFGNAGRNALTGPGYKNLDLAVIRYVPVGKSVRLQIRAEAFNLLNTLHLDLPDASVGSPTFGQVLSAGAPRRLQFGVRAVF